MAFIKKIAIRYDGEFNGERYSDYVLYDEAEFNAKTDEEIEADLLVEHNRWTEQLSASVDEVVDNA